MKETSGRKRMAVQTIYKYRQYSIQISELLKKRGALQRKDRGERFAVASGKLNWLKYRYFPTNFYSQYFQCRYTTIKNVHIYLQQAIPWLNGYESLLPQFHFCYLQPQSEDLEAAEEREREGEERWVIHCLTTYQRKFHTIFGLWKQNTQWSQRLWEFMWDNTWETTGLMH